MSDRPESATGSSPDVVVVGAGMGGLYAVMHLRQLGFSVVGLEAAPEVGGVWYHNNYPGSRVDLESDVFCFHFDAELYREWTWSERYAAQPEVLSYLQHVADRYDLRRSILLGTRVESVRWMPEQSRWVVETDVAGTFTPRFVIMATGQLSRPRDPDFPGLADFGGRWYQTSRWPHEPVDLAGKRVGVIGTGSSGVQTITAVAEVASHLTVFQRTPHFSIPARNRKPDEHRRQRMRARAPELYGDLLRTAAATFMPPPAGRAADFDEEDQYQLMEQRWDFGSQSMLGVFSDQMVDWDSGNLVTEFVKGKIAEQVDDPAVRASVVPDSYPLGTKRLILDTGYYQALNQPNVDLIDLRTDPLARITSTGIETLDRRVDLDVIIFATGFEAFTGALKEAGIEGPDGRSPVDLWDRGPLTHLGLQTHGFPNLFILCGPGSPSVLNNLYIGNTQQMDFIGGMLTRMRDRGETAVQPTAEAQASWTAILAASAESLIRRQINNYMVKVTDDGQRVYIPFGGGLPAYAAYCDRETAEGYPGFTFA